MNEENALEILQKANINYIRDIDKTLFVEAYNIAIQSIKDKIKKNKLLEEYADEIIKPRISYIDDYGTYKSYVEHQQNLDKKEIEK